ncbi:MAG TPA: hypothetical protein VIX59_08475 [Candidatus Binataceae bacterium]
MRLWKRLGADAPRAIRARLIAWAAAMEITAIVRAIAHELHRLNGAGVRFGTESAALMSLPRRERIRAVKAALAEKHRHPNHCC